MSTDTALAELEQSPQLLDHVAHLQAIVAAEQKRRERFIEEVDESMKAEFINGEVIVHSPSRLAHIEVIEYAATLLRRYVVRHRLGKVLREKALIRCRRNDYEPDISFFQTAKVEGWKPDTMLFPPPDLVVEVLSPSTARNDRTIKFQDYAAHGVSEYWIVDADARAIEQYTLTSGETVYTLLAHVTASDRLRSPTIRGFDVPALALFDERENDRVLAEILRMG